jgi:predicted phosphate transport protein (TIGR00153 family)
MRFSLIPKEEKFFDLLEDASANMIEASHALADFLKDVSSREQKAPIIKDFERKGDVMTHEILRKINRSFSTPLEREDIHALASNMDKILDAMESLANRLIIFRIQEMRPMGFDLCKILIEAIAEIDKAVRHMRSMKNLEEMEACCAQIARLESRSDTLTRQAVGELFDHAKPEDTLEIIKWKEIYERFETALDKCSRVAGVIEMILVKNA